MTDPVRGRWLDNRLAAMALAEGATPVDVPAEIATDVLERAGFFDAFAEMGVAAEDEKWMKTPAVCYHAYPMYAGRRLDRPLLLTAVGRCARREPDETASPSRLREFTMREIIFVGARDWVVATRQHWMDRTRDLADALGLRGTFETATDPFFAAGARGRKLMQQLKDLKIELRMHTGDAETAVASFNLHETFFSQRFDISLADGEPAWSGCAAFGIERWALAMSAR